MENNELMTNAVDTVVEEMVESGNKTGFDAFGLMKDCVILWASVKAVDIAIDLSIKGFKRTKAWVSKQAAIKKAKHVNPEEFDVEGMDVENDCKVE